MLGCPWDFLKDKQKHIISLVGGGGKTTIMYELAAYFATQGKKVVVLTTTHIWLPYSGAAESSKGAYAQDFAAVCSLWQKECYAVIGTLEEGTGKLVAPAASLLHEVLEQCDMVLIEADGAKQMPCKLPAEHEPVLLEQSDIVIAVAGLDALDKSLEEGCFRWQLGQKLFATSCNLLLDEVKLAQILLSENGSRKAVGPREYYIALNKCDLVEPHAAMKLRDLLVGQGVAKDRVWMRGKKHE